MTPGMLLGRMESFNLDTVGRSTAGSDRSRPGTAGSGVGNSPSISAIDSKTYDDEEAARDSAQEKEIQALLVETKLWRPVNSAQWVAWGIVQAEVPELDPRKLSTAAVAVKQAASKTLEAVKGIVGKPHVHPQSDPLEPEVRALQEDRKHDRPEGRKQEEEHEEGDDDVAREKENGDGDGNGDEDAAFDYLAYAQDRALFFWGDALQGGFVDESELPEELLRRIRVVKY